MLSNFRTAPVLQRLTVDRLSVSGSPLAVSLTSAVPDGASAIGFKLNTSSTLSNAAAKLLSVQNNGTEKWYVDRAGNVTQQGTLNVTSTIAINGVFAAFQYQNSLHFQCYTANTNNFNGTTFDAAYFDGTKTGQFLVRFTKQSVDSALAGIPNLGGKAGLYLGGLTTTERDALGGSDLRAGTLIFNSTTSKMNIYNGSAWRELTDAAV